MQDDKKQSNMIQKPWQFKPGKSGNPLGRPKKSPELQTAIQNLELGLYQTVTKLLDSPESFRSETCLDKILEDLLNNGWKLLKKLKEMGRHHSKNLDE